MNNEFNEVIEVAEGLNWSVKIDDRNSSDIMFSKFSPAGQDFNIEMNADSLDQIIEILKSRCEDFDCSYEAYLWLDSEGHGVNGAPYDMKEVYEDMEKCLEMMKELCEALEKIEE